MVNEIMNFIAQYDPEVGNAIKAEYARQKRNIELIASENIVSEAVMAAMGTVLTNKYAEGFPGKRYYASVLRSCLALNMPVYSLTRVQAQTWQFTLR